jgi:hypothetical protein
VSLRTDACQSDGHQWCAERSWYAPGILDKGLGKCKCPCHEMGFWVRYATHGDFWEPDFPDRSRQIHFESVNYQRCDVDVDGNSVLIPPQN